jgi:hypothetical protein
MVVAAVLVRPLPGGSFFGLLAEHGDRIVRMRTSLSATRRGWVARRSRRRSWPRSCCFSTARVCRTSRRCSAWRGICAGRVALGLAVDHEGWHPTSLTRYRARLLLHGKEGLALENTLRLAEEIGLLEGAVEQIIDSTPMLGAAATQDTVGLVGHGVRKLLDAVATADEAAAGRLADGLRFDYARPGEKPDCRWREKAERERMLTRVAEDAERALRAVEQAQGLLGDEGVGAAHGLLRELIGQDFDVDDDGVPRLHRATRSGRIISTVDTEMRHGRKSSQTRFDGYKLSAAATNTAEALITAVQVAPAGETDGPQAKHLIDAQPRARRAQRVLGDTA